MRSVFLTLVSLAFALSISSCGERAQRIEHVWSSPEEILTLSGHTQEILRATYNPDGALILTLSADSTARLWDGEMGSQVTVLAGHTGAVRAAVFLPNGEQIRTFAEDRQIKTWARLILPMTGW
jgi:WD40 repeat protein